MTTQTQTQTPVKTIFSLKEVQENAGCLARWIALYEAVNLIADKGEERGQKLEDIDFKPLDIKEYINGVEDIIHRKILLDLYNVHICSNDETITNISYIS